MRKKPKKNDSFRKPFRTGDLQKCITNKKCQEDDAFRAEEDHESGEIVAVMFDMTGFVLQFQINIGAGHRSGLHGTSDIELLVFDKGFAQAVAIGLTDHGRYIILEVFSGRR